MEHAETFTQSPAKKGGILSRLFAAVVNPVREHLAEVRKEFYESGKLKAEAKESAINDLIFDIGGSKNHYELKKKLEEQAKNQNNLFPNTIKIRDCSGYISVSINEVINHYKNLSKDEKQFYAKQKGVTSEEKRKEISDLNIKQWKETPEYIKNQETLVQNTIDNIINSRVDEDLSLMSNEEKQVIFEYQIYRTGLQKKGITVQDLINRYNQTGQENKPFLALENGDIQKYEEMTARLKSTLPPQENLATLEA